jgi:site-specific DNA recombinase
LNIFYEKSESIIPSSDSTLGAGLESIKRMTKAVLYARVSTDAQQKEATIDSQIAALKKQIAAAGHELVREYIDDGYTGTKLNRPGLERLRLDVKTDLFDAVYFLATDRIARDVELQMIIVGELLKHGKQIIINGKDYRRTAENKFTLVVLGAVDELERAKIIERMTRGKLHRLRAGQLPSHGVTPFGLDYLRKTSNSTGHFVMHEREAEAVRWMFEAFASGTGLCVITRTLEERGIRTKMGKTSWDATHVKHMLQNPVYTGTKYYNTLTTESVKWRDGSVHKRGGYYARDPSEWIAIKVPAIVSQELFDRVQERIKENNDRYLQPPAQYLLKGLVQCGECGSAYCSYRRYTTKTRKSGRSVYHRAAYVCLRRAKENSHSRYRLDRCHNSEIATHLLEDKIFELIREFILEPRKLRTCFKFTAIADSDDQQEARRGVARIAARIEETGTERRRMFERYASDQLPRVAYINANVALDSELEQLKQKKAAIAEAQPLNRFEELDEAIRQFCDRVAMRLERCTDFDTKRQFLVDHIEKIIYHRDKVTLIGCVPVALKEAQSITGSTLPFHIEGRIDRAMVRRLPKGDKKFSPDGQLAKSVQPSPMTASSTMPPASSVPMLA